MIDSLLMMIGNMQVTYYNTTCMSQIIVQYNRFDIRTINSQIKPTINKAALEPKFGINN